jgi:hypothetical protein
VNGGSVRRTTILHDATTGQRRANLPGARLRSATSFGVCDVLRELTARFRIFAPDAAAFGSHAYATFDCASIGYNDVASV